MKNLELGFRACSGTIAANDEFLAKMGKQPSPEQAATVVRVLRRIRMRAVQENLAIVGTARNEIRRWLKRTSYRDLRMVACRVLFAELRRAPKAKAATRSTIRKGIKFFPLLGMPFERCYRAITGRSSVAFEIRRRLNRLPDDAIVLQIGSNDGVSGDPLHELIVHHRKWRCVFVEPVPSVFANLQANYGIDSRFSFVRSAVNYGETAKFYYVDARVRQDIPHLPAFVEQFGSLDREHIVGYSNGILEPYIEELEVPGMSFQDLLAQQNLTDIHILHIDAEGYDWEILRQLDLEKIKPRLILFEHHHLSQADRVSSQQFLKPYYDITCHGGDFLCTLRPRWQS